MRKKSSKWKWIVCAIAFAIPFKGLTQEYVVYDIRKPLDLGNPGESPPRDYFINMGSQNGVQEGSILEIWRKAPSYDLVGSKLFKDITFPIARLKVIHADPQVSVARLEKMLPADKTPAIVPNAVSVGDNVKPLR